VKIGPVVSAENWLIEIALRVDVVVRRISSNISGYTGPIFMVFSPHESALHADDGTVLYFAIGQGTLPWQPIKVKLENAWQSLAYSPLGAIVLSPSEYLRKKITY